MKHLDATAKITTHAAARWLPALVAVLLAAVPALAWTEYSVDKDTGNCADCHGKFTEGPYTSLVDGQTWPGSLHDVHRQDMLDSDWGSDLPRRQLRSSMWVGPALHPRWQLRLCFLRQRRRGHRRGVR